MTEDSINFAEIRELIKGFGPLPATSCENANIGWIRRAQNSCKASLDHPRISVFVGAHGFALQTQPESKTHFNKYVKSCVEGTGLLNRLCLNANTDLRLYDLDSETPTANLFATPPPPIDWEDTARSMAYGMMALEPGLHLAAATMAGPGAQESAKAIYHLHTQEPTQDLTILRLMKLAGSARGLQSVVVLGGREFASLCGLILAARLAQTPVLLSGIEGAASLMALTTENKNACDHCALLIKKNEGFSALPHLQIEIDASLPDLPAIDLACFIPILKNEVLLAEFEPEHKLIKIA